MDWLDFLVKSKPIFHFTYLCAMLNRQVIAPIALRFGFFCGVCHSIMTIAVIYFGGTLYDPAMFFGVVLTIAFTMRCIKSIRENEGEGFITFKHAFFTGVALSFFAFLLYGLVVYLLGALVFTDMLSHAINEMLRSVEMLDGILNESQRDTLLDGYEKLTLGELAFNDASSKFFWGIFISLILALILKKKPPVQPISHE